jgi:hypothetical protein
MSYQVCADDGSLLDAHLDIDGTMLVFHSRGGSKGDKARNVDYSPALRLLLERLSKANLSVERAWVDSSRVQNIPLADRMILSSQDSGASADQLVSRMGLRMQAVGREITSKTDRGNATKRIRLQLSGTVSQRQILAAINVVISTRDFRSEEKLSASDLQKVNARHLLEAIQSLRDGYKDHDFFESDGYDVLLEDGVRFPPKAVFGIAATTALRFKVLPKHFSGGKGTVCFHVLEGAGYCIVPKGVERPSTLNPGSGADREWLEGTPQLKKHLRRERADGLSAAKKVDFKDKHGRLFCERCHSDPVKQYESEDGEACIEVHHHRVQVADMGQGHVTKLEDLMCLCANCHRVEHRRIRNALKAN